MKSIRIVLFACALLTTLYACNRKDNTCVAGTGGKLTIVAYLQHHGKPIYSQSNYHDTVFLKFNTQNLPGVKASDFDTYFVGNDTENFVTLTGLKCGEYYIYGAGYDTSIFQRVVGGIPYNTSESSGTISINLPVTEGD